MLGLSDAGLDGWGAPMVVAGLAAAAVVLPLFVLAERPLADLAWGGRCLVFANAGPVDADAEQGQGRDRVVLLGPLEVEDEQEQQREAREAGTVLPEALAALTETPEGSLGWLGECAGRRLRVPGRPRPPVPAEGGLRVGGRGRADLLVAAAVRRPGQRLLHGAFAGHLAYHAPCPVLVVH